MISIECEEEAKPVDALPALGPQDDSPVDDLPRASDLYAIIYAERRRQRSVAKAASRVARMSRGESE